MTVRIPPDINPSMLKSCLDLWYFRQWFWNWEWKYKIFEGELLIMSLLTLLHQIFSWLSFCLWIIFLITLMPVKVYHNYKAAFGRCEHEWVYPEGFGVVRPCNWISLLHIFINWKTLMKNVQGTSTKYLPKNIPVKNCAFWYSIVRQVNEFHWEHGLSQDWKMAVQNSIHKISALIDLATLQILIPTTFNSLLCQKWQFTLQSCHRRWFVRKRYGYISQKN